MNGVAQSTWDIEIIWAILIVKLNKLKQWGIQIFIAPALLPLADQDTDVDIHKSSCKHWEELYV